MYICIGSGPLRSRSVNKEASETEKMAKMEIKVIRDWYLLIETYVTNRAK